MATEDNSTAPSHGDRRYDRTEDRSGRRSLVRNVLSSWLGYLVTLVLGFVLPRVIDENVGQASLGVWDFCWTLVHYMSLSMLGVGASVNRYVARYRATDDVSALNSTISSVIAVQAMVACFVLAVTLGLVWVAPTLASVSDSSLRSELAYVVLFLGSSLAVQMAFDSNRGIISGCHHWDYHNGITAGGQALASASMIVALLSGGGLVSMALVYLLATIATELVRLIVARNVCPELDVKVGLINKADIQKVFKFGLKTVMVGVPSTITQQTVNLFIVTFLGPAALAVFARPMALVKYSAVFIDKFAFVLTPTVGALQKISEGAVREFALKSARAGVLLSIPPLCFLAILGGPLVELWMGNAYVNAPLIFVLALGYFIPMSQRPVLQVLIGMNQHGKLMVSGLISSTLILGLSLAYLTATGWSLLGSAFAVVLPMSLGYSILVPFYACRQLSIRATEFARAATRGATTLAFGSVIVLIVAKKLFEGQPVLQIASGSILLGAFVGLALRAEIVAAAKTLR